MAKVNITKAASLAGITRQHFYKKYLNPAKGKPLITVEEDPAGRKVIDTAELLRVFGEFKGDTGDNEKVSASLRQATPEKTQVINDLQSEVNRLREQLEQSTEREQWLMGKMDLLGEQLKATTKLLEHQPQDKQPGIFDRLFGKK